MPNAPTDGAKLRDKAEGRDPGQHTWQPTRPGPTAGREPTPPEGVFTHSSEAQRLRAERAARGETTRGDQVAELRGELARRGVVSV